MSATVKGCPALGGGEDSHGVEGLLGRPSKLKGMSLCPMSHAASGLLPFSFGHGRPFGFPGGRKEPAVAACNRGNP